MRTHRVNPSQAIPDMRLPTWGPSASAIAFGVRAGCSETSASVSPARAAPAASRRLARVAELARAGRTSRLRRFVRRCEAVSARGSSGHCGDEVSLVPPAAHVNGERTRIDIASSVVRGIGSAIPEEEFMTLTHLLRLGGRRLLSSARRLRIPALRRSGSLLPDFAEIREPGRSHGPIRNFLPYCRRLRLPDAPFE
jgi:hypothetical protein